jgi:hypothetical protein
MTARNSVNLDSSNNASTRRQPSNLNARLDKSLLTYVATAGAAGVSLLAMTQPANAKVVYTPYDGSVIQLDHGRLDLNHDGIPDFGFIDSGIGTEFFYNVAPFKLNKMMNQAAPLAAGVSVGPGASFAGGIKEMAFFCVCSGLFSSQGPWANQPDEYMGFEFTIKGQHHFGWARFSVTSYFTGVILTGYAYETVPLKPIVTGDTGAHNDEEDAVVRETPTTSSPQASGLGKLALGAAGRTAH